MYHTTITIYYILGIGIVLNECLRCSLGSVIGKIGGYVGRILVIGGFGTGCAAVLGGILRERIEGGVVSGAGFCGRVSGIRLMMVLC